MEIRLPVKSFQQSKLRVSRSSILVIMQLSFEISIDYLISMFYVQDGSVTLKSISTIRF